MRGARRVRLLHSPPCSSRSPSPQRCAGRSRTTSHLRSRRRSRSGSGWPCRSARAAARRATWSASRRAAQDGLALRDVAEVLDAVPPFTPKLVELIRWAEEYYLVPPGELLRAALPPGLNTRKGRGRASAPRRRVRGARACRYRRPPRALSCPGAARVLEYLLARGRIPVEELRAAFPSGRPALTALARRGVVRLEREVPVVRSGLLAASASPPALTPAQAAALDGDRRRALGTLRAVPAPRRHRLAARPRCTCAPSRARARAGKGALVLVPEIALTPQLVGRFRARFGDDVARAPLRPHRRASATTSGSALRARRGARRHRRPQRALRAGARPRRSSSSTRSTTARSSRKRRRATTRATWRSCARSARARSSCSARRRRRSRARARRAAAATAGSCCPRARRDRPMPEVELVDLRSCAAPGATGTRRSLSPPSPTRSRRRSPAGEQTILFLNRRGFATLVVCEACGADRRAAPTARSRSRYHRGAAIAALPLLRPTRARCPSAARRAAAARSRSGVGTEQARGGGREALPRARASRGSIATGRERQDSRRACSRACARREIDVLVGTQMVTKGHDFPGVTLVGVVIADTALALPDFRAARAHLPAPRPGRRARGARRRRRAASSCRPSTPRRPRSRCASCARLRRLRRGRARAPAARHGYPPFGRLLAVRVEGSEAGARRAAEVLAAAARPASLDEVAMLGPAPAAIERIPRPHPLPPPLPRERAAGALPRPRRARARRPPAARRRRDPLRHGPVCDALTVRPAA